MAGLAKSTRRGFIAGAAAIAGMGAIDNEAFARLMRGHGTASVIPVVGPKITAPAWNGTPLSGSGGVAPTHPNWDGVYPVAKWWQPGNVWLSDDVVIGVYASAFGGVTSVKFHGDIPDTIIAQATVYSDLDARGLLRKRLGYWIRLSKAAFTAVSSTGEARIFATATAANGAMITCVLGNDATVGNSLTDWQMSVFPRSYGAGLEGDFNGDIGPSQTYATPTAFFNAARTANAEHPVGTIVESGAYDLVNGAAGTAGTANAKGFAVLKCAPGVTATLRRSTAFDGANLASNAFRLGWHGIEFRGLITIDLKNIWAMVSNKSCLLNGVKVTNTDPDWQIGQNEAPKDAFAIRTDASGSLPFWHVDSIYEYQACPTGFSPMSVGCKFRSVTGDPFDWTCWAANFYIKGVRADQYYGGVSSKAGAPAMTLAYNGAGTATIDHSPGGVGAGLLTLKVNGSTVQTFTEGANTSQPRCSVADLVADINAYGNGWSASAIAATANSQPCGSRFMLSYSNLAISSGGTVLKTIYDVHVELFHNYGFTAKNVAFLNGVSTGFSVYSTGLFYLESPVKNMSVKGLIFDRLAGTDGGQTGFNSGGTHLHVAECYFGGTAYWPSSLHADPYSMLEQSVVEYFNGQSYGASIRDRVLCGGNVAAPSPSPDAQGNISAGSWITPNGSATLLATINNKAAVDYRPAGILLNAPNYRTRISEFDAFYNPKLASTTIGPMSSAPGTPAPTYFDFDTAP